MTIKPSNKRYNDIDHILLIKNFVTISLVDVVLTLVSLDQRLAISFTAVANGSWNECEFTHRNYNKFTLVSRKRED